MNILLFFILTMNLGCYAASSSNDLGPVEFRFDGSGGFRPTERSIQRFEADVLRLRNPCPKVPAAHRIKVSFPLTANEVGSVRSLSVLSSLSPSQQTSSSTSIICSDFLNSRKGQFQCPLDGALMEICAIVEGLKKQWRDFFSSKKKSSSTTSNIRKAATEIRDAFCNDVKESAQEFWQDLKAPRTFQPPQRVSVDPLLLCDTQLKRFSMERVLFIRKLENIVHPILHGCAEIPQNRGALKELLSVITQSGIKFFEGDGKGAYDVMKNNGTLGNHAREITSSICHRWIGPRFFEGLFGEGSSQESFQRRTEAAQAEIIEAVLGAERGIEYRFPHWNHNTTCPGGIFKCPNLSAQSRQLLMGINQFFSNISAYETKRGMPFFTVDTEVDGLMFFLNTMTRKICETNIFHTAFPQHGGSGIDKSLMPFQKMVNYLIAIPTEMHNPNEHYHRNKDKIDNLIRSLEPEAQRNVEDFIFELIERCEQPNYGHDKSSGGSNVIFYGPTGCGKTRTMMELLELLGFPLVTMSLHELMSGYDSGSVDMGCAREGEISGLESQILRLRPDGKRGIGFLNMVVGIDEVASGRQFSFEGWKQKFDQFRRLRLPGLGLTLPGHVSCIFTTNPEDLTIEDPAVRSRLFFVHFNEKTVEDKIEIVMSALLKKIETRPALMAMWENGEFKEFITQYVTYDLVNGNLRVLLAGLDSIVSHFNRKIQIKNGDSDLQCPADKEGADETDIEFIRRRFGGIMIGCRRNNDMCSSSSTISTSGSSSDRLGALANTKAANARKSKSKRSIYSSSRTKAVKMRNSKSKHSIYSSSRQVFDTSADESFNDNYGADDSDSE